MYFGQSFAWHFLFIMCLDTCWLQLHFTCLPPDAIYPDIKTAPMPKTILCCIVCWTVSALYLAGHQHDTELESFIEGAWTGGFAYTVFNFTTLAMDARWTIKASLADILWGASLFAIASLITFKIG